MSGKHQQARKNFLHVVTIMYLFKNTSLASCIGVGSPGLIAAFTQLGLIDEYQLGVQPTVLGNGLPLFKNIRDRIDLNS